MSKHDSPTYTRWQGQYAWPEGYKGLTLYPEVYADNAEEAKQLAIKAYRSLFGRHGYDWSWWLFVPIGNTKDGGFKGRELEYVFDPERVTVVDIGLPYIIPVDFKVAPFPEVDTTYLSALNDFDVLKGP